MKDTAPFAVVILAACLWSTGAAAQLIDDAGVDLEEADVVYTLTNLHPDEQRARLYAVNFLQPGLIPRCSAVRITRLRRNRMNFVLLETDKEYTYRNHDAAAEPFNDHLLRFFGSECDPTVIEQLSDVDQDGIRQGMAQEGMTRQGVIYAIGYPPRHVNPSIERGDWTYWESRFDRIIVEFDENGVVTGIRD